MVMLNFTKKQKLCVNCAKSEQAYRDSALPLHYSVWAKDTEMENEAHVQHSVDSRNGLNKKFQFKVGEWRVIICLLQSCILRLE